jgi:hypothetical protein
LPALLFCLLFLSFVLPLVPLASDRLSLFLGSARQAKPRTKVKLRNLQLHLPETQLKGVNLTGGESRQGGRDMKKFKMSGKIAGILFLVALWIAIAPRVQAQDDQPLRITFSQAVQIPGRVLPAGTYIFQRRMEGFAADENLIQISNSDGTRIITFVQTLPATRKNISEATEFTFARSPEGQPPRWWPGRSPARSADISSCTPNEPSSR